MDEKHTITIKPHGYVIIAGIIAMFLMPVVLFFHSTLSNRLDQAHNDMRLLREEIHIMQQRQNVVVERMNAMEKRLTTK